VRIRAPAPQLIRVLCAQTLGVTRSSPESLEHSQLARAGSYRTRSAVCLLQRELPESAAFKAQHGLVGAHRQRRVHRDSREHREVLRRLQCEQGHQDVSPVATVTLLQKARHHSGNRRADSARGPRARAERYEQAHNNALKLTSSAALEWTLLAA